MKQDADGDRKQYPTAGWSFARAQGLEADLRDKYDESISYNDVMSAAMYPKVFDEYRRETLRLCKASWQGIARWT